MESSLSNMSDVAGIVVGLLAALVLNVAKEEMVILLRALVGGMAKVEGSRASKGLGSR